MKKPTLLLNNLKNKHFLLAWLIFHVGIFTLFWSIFIFKHTQIKIDADLFNMLPKSFDNASIRAADDKLTAATGQNVFILVSSEDFSLAKFTAEKVYKDLEGSKNFMFLNLYNDLSAIDDVTDFIFKYRWNMLSPESIDLINEEGGEWYFAQNALAQAYSPFTMMPLDALEEDPFMLGETNLNNYLTALQKSGISMSVKDNVLSAEKDGRWYVMIRGILSAKGAALASKDNGVTEIYNVCSPLENDAVRFVYSGTPFHSHESSNSASKEIAIISSISMLVVIIVLLTVFRSPIPLLGSVVSIIISIVTAILSTLACFKQMHILTLVFGTSLIGSCIDYSIHYFTHWAGNADLKSGEEIRKTLLPGLLMAIISSGLCYVILIFAPFGLLKQMALFSVSGLISSFLTTICIYPYIPLPKGERKIFFLKKWKFEPNGRIKKNVGRAGVSFLFAFSVLFILIFHKNLRIENNVSKLYTMEGRLLNDEAEANSIIKYSPTGWFIISGNTSEEALRNEELLRKKLGELTNNNIGYACTSLFIPSIEQQKASREACKKLLEIADFQLDALGYDENDVIALKKIFADSENDYISFENNNIPEFLMESISSAWLGEINGKYYTVIMPNLIEDSAAFKAIAEEDDNIFFINKMLDMGNDLDKLTKMVLKFFAIAYVVMFVMLKFFYKSKQAFKIISIPGLIMLFIAAIFAMSNTRLEFFSVTGLILVLGLGLDYIIYMMENENSKDEDVGVRILEPFAIGISFFTTVVSFGALALSSFAPVHLMGLSIFIGLTTAYVSSTLYDRSL